MNNFDILFFISTIDELIFSCRGKHLDDLELAILQGVFENRKYADIAKNNHRSGKYVKDLAGKLWQTLSIVLGEKISKSNIKSSLQRYHHYNSVNLINKGQGNKQNIYAPFLESELIQSKKY